MRSLAWEADSDRCRMGGLGSPDENQSSHGVPLTRSQPNMDLAHHVRGLTAILFVLFAFLTQLLIIDFAARNWRPSLESEHGWLVYAVGIPGHLLGIGFLSALQPWYIVAGPVVYAIWSEFGCHVDRYRPIEWRSPPRWPVFLCYVVPFMAGQFFFWIPLWYVGTGYWIAFTVTYIVNTGLSVFSHRKSGE